MDAISSTSDCLFFPPMESENVSFFSKMLITASTQWGPILIGITILSQSRMEYFNFFSLAHL